MQITNPRPLDALVKAIQRKWGFKALRKASDASATPLARLSTGSDALDQVLQGGLPRGHITELVGVATSGLHTVALKAVAQAQGEGEAVAYVDLDNTFNPAYATHCGIDLSNLLLIRPHVPATALDIVLDVVYHGAGVFVWDSVTSFLAMSGGSWRLARALLQLKPLLAESQCVGLFLTRVTARPYLEGAPALQHHAALRLRLHTTGWQRHHDLITGYEVGIAVLRNQFGAEGGRASLVVEL